MTRVDKNFTIGTTDVRLDQAQNKMLIPKFAAGEVVGGKALRAENKPFPPSGLALPKTSIRNFNIFKFN